MNASDSAWLLTATALTLFMALPGLGLFYGGLVRGRNVLSVFTHCYGIACIASVGWLVIGYSIAFGGANPFWGGFEKVLLLGVERDHLSGTIPESLFFTFQMVFAIIAPALIVGAYVERVNFGFVMAFSLLWMLLCYAPVAHWVWGGGFLADGGIFGENGVRDFAGGIVVHETAGFAALVLAIMLGPRKVRTVPPHSPGYVMIGGAMLWVGWFGFNGGSQLAADGGAAMAITVTHLSAAAAALGWGVVERIRYGKVTLVGLLTGSIGGLAAVTPAAGWIGPLEALLIGIAAGGVCHFAVGLVRVNFNIDDSLDVFAVHGIGGVLGTLAIALFGHGSWIAQGGSLVIVGVFTIIATYVIAKIVSLAIPMRASQEAESIGLDVSQHGERAYDHNS